MCPSHGEISPTCKMKWKVCILDGVFKHMHYAVCTGGKRKAPYWSINKPHIASCSPMARLHAGRHRKHIVFPLSCTQSWFSQQNIPFSSFQLIKISAGHFIIAPASALTSWKWGMGRSWSRKRHSLPWRQKILKFMPLREKFTKEVKNTLWSVYIYIPVYGFHNTQASTYTYGKGEI